MFLDTSYVKLSVPSRTASISFQWRFDNSNVSKSLDYLLATVHWLSAISPPNDAVNLVVEKIAVSASSSENPFAESSVVSSPQSKKSSSLKYSRVAWIISLLIILGAISFFFAYRKDFQNSPQTTNTNHDSSKYPFLDGSYRDGSGGITKYYKSSDGGYTFSSSDCTGFGYWDSNRRLYLGIFRYNDHPKNADSSLSKGGVNENAVGYHTFEPLSERKFKVTYQWGLGHTDGNYGSFEIERVSD